MTQAKSGALGAFGHLMGIFFSREEKLRHGQRFLTLMEGGTFNAILAAFENHPDGQALLAARPDTEALLADREDLSRRPPGSFGRSYLEFLVPNDFDAADYTKVAKQASVGFSADPKRTWLRHRIDTIHDVRHILTGYGADLLGEACILAFRVSQVGHRGAAVLATGAGIGCFFIDGPVATIKALAEAYRRGRSATLVDLCPFEFDLSEPLESYRAKLGLTPPRAYQRAVARKARAGLPTPYTAESAGQETSV